MALTPFDGELDAPIAGLTPFSGKLDGESEGMADTIKKGISVAGESGAGLLNRWGYGSGLTAQEIGRVISAPAATALEMATGLGAAISDEDHKAGRQEFARSVSDYADWQRKENRNNGNAFADLGGKMEELGKDTSKHYEETLPESSPMMAQQLKNVGEAEGFVGNLKAMATNPLGTAGNVMTSMPDMAVGAGMGAVAGKAGAFNRFTKAEAALAADKAGSTAFVDAMAKGATDDVARAAASDAASAAYGKVAQGSAERLAGSVGLVSEAGQSGMQNRIQTEQYVMDKARIPDEMLYKNNSAFRGMVDSGMSPDEARASVARELGNESGALGSLFTGAGSKITGAAEAMGKTIAGGKITGKQFALNVGKESMEEGLQNPGENWAQYVAQKQVNPNEKYDFGGSLAQGIVMGAAMGGPIHGAGYIQSRMDKSAVPELPDTGPMSRSANVALQTGAAADAASVLGVPASAEQAADQIAPKSMDAIGRVQQIDQQIQSADPEQAASMKAERDQITASWPRAVSGAPTSFSTESGARIDGNYALMEAHELVTSHDESLKPNPAYPREMQPRERDRAASEMQISGIAQRLDPARLGESGDAGTGAPIVGADGLVESGNARTIALKRVYQGDQAKAEAYRQYLKDNAARFGLTPEAVDAMNTPVLVRVRNTPVDRAEFARQANASTVAQMSPSEQARSDAARIDDMGDMQPDDNGDFAASRDFIRRFVSRLPATEQGSMVDANGQLSQAGYARIRNAVLAKAYGESPVLSRMVESMDDNMRNVGRALIQAAPEIAKLRQDVSEGALFDADITPDLLAAVEELSRIKDSGRSVSDYLSQAGIFGDAISPEARDLLQFLAKNLRRPRKIAEFIQRYAEALRAAGSPNQGSLLGDTVAPSKRDIINVASEKDNAETQAVSPTAGDSGKQGANQGANKGAENIGDKGAGRPAGEKPASTPGYRGGAQEGEGDGQRLIAEIQRLNPQLKANLSVEWVDEDDPRVIQLEKTEGGKAKGGHNGSRIIMVRGRADIQTLLHEIRHMIDMLLGGYELRKWLASDSDLMGRMVDYLKKERSAGRIDEGSRMTDAEETAQSVLDAYYRNKEGLRAEFPDVVGFLEQMGADKYAGLMQNGNDAAAVDANQGQKTEQGEWVAFPAETGTLGIPRADMPQIRGDARGALTQFLAARGIENTTEDVPAETLRPTQAEFSTKKALNWGEMRDGTDRSVLVSSDGFILDGHHQWIAALAAGDNVKAIRFNAPIDKLMGAVFEFPSVRRGDGAVPGRAKAREDFQAALADLGALLRQMNPGVAMLTPEDKVKLMPTLVRLFESGIRELGYSMKELLASVKKAMRASDDEFVKKHWNKIDEKTYRDAAAQAIDNVQNGEAKPEAGKTADMFAMPKPGPAPVQQDLFAAMEKAVPSVFAQAQDAPAGDMAGRTDAQLMYVAQSPRNEEKRAAAAAELSRRGIEVQGAAPKVVSGKQEGGKSIESGKASGGQTSAESTRETAATSQGAENGQRQKAEVLTTTPAPAAKAPGNNPKEVYRAYVLKDSDRESLLKQFPPSHPRVIADHISAEALDSMDRVVDGPATGKVIGYVDAEGIQSLIVEVNGTHLTSKGTPFHITWSSDPGKRTGSTGALVKRTGFTRLEKPITIDLSDGPAYSAPLSPVAPELTLGDKVPPKDKPVVMVFGGSFNPIHSGHVDSARNAKKMMEAAGYTVEKVIIVPSPQHLLVKKSGAEAQMLGDRFEMAKRAFAHLHNEGFMVVHSPSRIADELEGVKKPKRADAADWVQEKNPHATIVSVAGEDTAPGNPPGFPSLYLYETTSGKNPDGYYYLAVARDEESPDNISSSKIRKNIESDKEVPAEWMNSATSRYYRALVKKSNEIAVDGVLYDLDAADFGQPYPKTLPDDSPLLKETYSKDSHDEIAKSNVVYEGETISRQEMWDHIVDEAFDKAVPVSGRKPIAYVMGGGGASGKGTVKKMLRAKGVIQAADAVDIDADEIKGKIPEYSEPWKVGDSRGAAIVHEESSMLSKKVRERAIDGKFDVILDVTLGNPEKGVEAIKDLQEKGYEVRLFGVNIDPENAVARAIQRGFDPERGGRFVPLLDLLKAHKGFSIGFESYADAADTVQLYETTDGVLLVAEKEAGRPLVIKHQKAYNRFAERRFINERSKTYREVGSYRQGTFASVREERADGGRVPQGGKPGSGIRVDQGGNRSGEDSSQDQGEKGGVNANLRPSEIGPEGKEPDAIQKPGSKRGSASVRSGKGGPDAGRNSNPDNGNVGQGSGEDNGPDGGGESPEGVQLGGKGNRPGTNAGIPAGIEVPAKTGRNYAFGESDLTYEGGWFKKAAQNVEAVELLKSLEKEGRQATREEQSILAKFIGWGASDLANNLFGTKLDAKLQAIAHYEDAIGWMNEYKRDSMQRSQGRHYAAFMALKTSGATDENASFYDPKYAVITRAQLEAAKPDMSVKRWDELRSRLRSAMTGDELDEASRSTQYAHYTSKPIVQSMLSALQRMGFKGGTILEPGAGIGVFPGLMPVEMANNSVYTGIEFDQITGGILKQLFPDERILVESFVDSALPANYYDVAFGNPPFGNIPILADPKYKKYAFSLHDYFFAKTIDSVKPGGLVPFVTSRYTMDKLDDKARAYLAERADLVGAIRLPQTAFKKNAGTDVVTDVLFLRKKVPGEAFEGGQPWAKSVPITINGRQFNINEYFHAHPEMVLGTHSDAGKMANSPDPQYTVEAIDGDIDALFDRAAMNLPADIYKAGRGSAAEAAKVREIDFNPKAKKEGNYYVSDAGALMVREGGVGKRSDMAPKKAEIVRAFVPLRDALKQAHYDQLNGGEWEKSLSALQDAYKAFVKKHGKIHQNTTYVQNVKVEELDDEGVPTGKKVPDTELRYRFPVISAIDNDPDWTLVASLESFNAETGEIKDGAFLKERVLNRRVPVKVETPTDAMLQVLNDVGKVDITETAKRIGLSEQETIDSLGALVYDDPEKGWVTADDYLSGDIRKKLKAAEAAAKTDKRMQRNVEALVSALPTAKTAAEITPQIGMSWIPTSIYEQFIREKAGVRANVTFNERTGQWDVQAISGHKGLGATDDWGTNRRNAADILGYALSGAPVRIMSPVVYGNEKKDVFDPVATQAVTEKLNNMREAFKTWLWEDAGRVDSLVKIYNEKFNSIVPRSFNGDHLTLPGVSEIWLKRGVFSHVLRGAWRIIQQGNTYLAHAVGSGKTNQMIISAMEQKRLGLIQKPMMVVPNHMLKQFASEWQDLYPAARLMVADEANFTGDNRRRFVSRVALSDLDGVIITHSAFKLLDLDPAFKQKMIEEELEYMRAAYKEAGGSLDDLSVEKTTNEKGVVSVKVKSKGKSREPKIKQIEKKIERMEQRLQALMSSEGKDKNVRFDEMGVDMLYVDEAHEFRKLDFATQRQVKGVDSNGSDKSFDLYMKVQWLRENKNPSRNLVMASGTPVTNTLAEIYSVQKFMAPDVLAERGLEEFDQWASMFGAESTNIEPDASGKYGPVTRFNKFVNVGELTQMFREFSDVLTSDYLAATLGDKRPKVKGGSRNMMITPKTPAYVEFQRDILQPRMEASRKWKPSREEPNNPDPIIAIIGDGRLAAIDLRFMNPSAPNDPDSKLNKMIDEVIRIYKETADREFTTDGKPGSKVEPAKGAVQMVFADLGFGAGVAANRGFNARAWFEKRLRDAGVKPEHVAFMSDNKKSSAKVKLFRDMNAGRVRIAVGSSKNMGTGVNAQQRLVALHHLDSPWYPADLEQREGRIVRQGNKHKEVELYAYAMKGSYDEQMWSTLARKQFFIDQALSGDANIREIEDLGESSQFEIAAAMVADDPRVLQLAGLRAEVEKLGRLRSAHDDQRGRMQREYAAAEARLGWIEQKLADLRTDAAKVQDITGDKFTAKADGKTFNTRKEWGQALMARYKDLSDHLVDKETVIGSISGFDVIYQGRMSKATTTSITTYTDGTTKTETSKRFESAIGIRASEPTILAQDVTSDPVGVAMRAQTTLAGIARAPAALESEANDLKAKRNALEPRLTAQFPMLQMLLDKMGEAAVLEDAIVASGQALTGLEREQELEDAWQARTGAITPLFSRGNGAGMAVRDLKSTVDRVASGFKNLPKVHVFASPAELSTKDPAQKALADFILKAGAWEDVEGAMHQGEIYLFASGLADAARAEHVLATHEVTHYGLRGAIGKGLDAALQHIWLNNADVRKQAAAIKRRNGLASNVEAVEEIIADLPAANLAKLAGWRRVVKAVRDWLNKAGATKLAGRLDAWMKAGLSDQEKADLFVADLVNSARNFVRKGKPNGGVLMDGTRLADGTLAEDVARQEKWLTAEAKARGYSSIDELAEKNYPAFEKLAAKWREQNPVENALLSRASNAQSAGNAPTAADRADAILAKPAAKWRPVDAVMRSITRATGIEKATGFVYDKVGNLLDRYTPEQVKAGVISDYGIPEAVIDRRIEMQGRQRVQIREAGTLLEKLSTLTRAESRLAYEWMNNADPQAAAYFEAQLPPESLKVMEEVKGMIDALSKEAVALGQLSPEAFKRNRFEYLHRSYAKHTAELTKGEVESRKRATAILGEQYKGRGMTDLVDMKKIQNIAPEWWGRKLQDGKADKGLVEEKFIRFERRAPSGAGVMPLHQAQGPGNTNPQKPGKLLEVAYWPAGEPVPAKFGAWDEAGTWVVRDTKGGSLVVWRDFTKAERIAMGEIDEARYAIAKTLHGMIHDIETGRYLEWIGQTYGKLPGEKIDGEIIEAKEMAGLGFSNVFPPGTWVQVPESKIPGTQVSKYGKLAGQFIPGPIWNDVRQTVGFRFKPLGELYSKILGAWKTAKTALSPAVHTNNVMANFVMADWHDVGSGHVAKALRIILGASQREGKWAIGRAGNVASRAGIADAEAAREIINRFQESGANMGSWINAELQREQLEPLLDALEAEIGLAGQHAPSQVGAFAALQLALRLRFPSAWEAAKPTIGVQAIKNEARSMIDLYEAEDQVFRLAAWLKAKEDGESDLSAGRRARRSFLDYNINAPWVQAMRQTALPFVSFSYRAIPMALEVAARKPHKMMKIAMFAALANALGYLMAGGDEDEERKLLPEEKAGRIWGLVPKLIRMPWNDKFGSPVFLDIRRFVPVGDVFDTGQSHSALPLLPVVVPGGPLAVLSELAANKSQFTGKAITLDTDTATEKASKVADHLYKAFAPNIIILPGTYAWTGVENAAKGRTDTFGREQSVSDAAASAFGIKLGSYPADVLQLNLQRATQFKMMEIDNQITQLKREYQRNGITEDEFMEKVEVQRDKKLKILEEFQKKVGG